MKTFYIIGTNSIDEMKIHSEKRFPLPGSIELFEVEAETFEKAVKVASEHSNKRFFGRIELVQLTQKDS